MADKENIEVSEEVNQEVRADLATRFQAGNRSWMARSSHGRKPKFATPEALETACHEYFDWNSSNPLIEYKPNAQGDNYIPRMRAMTLTALRRFIDLSAQSWLDYKAKPDFAEVISDIEEIVRDQKLEGAAAGFLNANIIARELGLRDGMDSKVEATVDVTKLPTDQLLNLFIDLKKEMSKD